MIPPFFPTNLEAFIMPGAMRNKSNIPIYPCHGDEMAFSNCWSHLHGFSSREWGCNDLFLPKGNHQKGSSVERIDSKGSQ